MKKRMGLSRYFSVLRGVKLPWLLILCSFAVSYGMTRSEIQVATLTASIIDASQNAINGAELLKFLSATVLAAAFTIVSTYFERRMEETVTQRVRVKLWNKILTLPSAYYDSDSGDGLISRVTSDASAPASLFTMAVSCVVCVVTTVNAFLQLFSYHEALGTLALLIIPLTLLVCLLNGIFQFKLGVYGTTTMAGSLSYLAQRVRNFRLIKSAVAEKLEQKQGKRTFVQMYKADFLSWMLVAMYQLANSLFSIMFIVITFVVGSRYIAAGEVTVGDLTGFYMICGVVSIQLMQFFMNAGSVTGAFGTMKKMAEVMEAPSEPMDGKPAPEQCSSITFRDVSFSYDGQANALHDVNVTIPMGRITAIIGGNGAGKTTMFKLLCRLYEPDSGQITFGGENIRDYSLHSWREKFAYVFQQLPLIGGTVRENITYGLNREVTQEELLQVAKAANCCDCILAKPQGFDADVGLDGSNFSGGQGQCISIARAMLRNADYLLLDEATSNLDVVSAAQVTEATESLMRGRTTVMIAHDCAATRSAQYIIIMRDGTVEDAGTPEELLQRSDYYRAFCKQI